MRKIILIIYTCTVFTTYSFAQGLLINSKYEPFSYAELANMYEPVINAHNKAFADGLKAHEQGNFKRAIDAFLYCKNLNDKYFRGNSRKELMMWIADCYYSLKDYNSAKYYSYSAYKLGHYDALAFYNMCNTACGNVNGEYATTKYKATLYRSNWRKFKKIPKYCSVEVIYKNENYYWVKYRNLEGYIHEVYLEF